MDKIQQEFETWAKTTSLKNFLFWHPSDNQYEVHAVQMAFEGWKASRAALCVELPTSLGYPNNDMVYLSDVEDRIENCGVSYK